MFEGIVGGDLHNVVLVTTMWDLVEEDEGQARERELRSQFLEKVIEGGARMERSVPTADLAWKLIGDVSAITAKPVLLQDEMGRQKKALLQTTAASVLSVFTNLLLSLRDRARHIRSHFRGDRERKGLRWSKLNGRRLERRFSLLAAVQRVNDETSSQLSSTSLDYYPSPTSSVSPALSDTSSRRGGVLENSIADQSKQKRWEALSLTVETLKLVSEVAAVVPCPLLKTLVDLSLNITQRVRVSRIPLPPSSRLNANF
jgi:hypothetical protein